MEKGAFVARETGVSQLPCRYESPDPDRMIGRRNSRINDDKCASSVPRGSRELGWKQGFMESLLVSMEANGKEGWDLGGRNKVGQGLAARGAAHLPPTGPRSILGEHGQVGARPSAMDGNSPTGGGPIASQNTPRQTLAYDR